MVMETERQVGTGIERPRKMQAASFGESAPFVSEPRDFSGF